MCTITNGFILNIEREKAELSMVLTPPKFDIIQHVEFYCGIKKQANSVHFEKLQHGVDIPHEVILR